jgi:diguanylate cyclase (GGDEF)-like protein
MLDSIYGRTQNYGKTEYELYTHLAEVTGAFGKYMFKRKERERAKSFLPKIFAWSVALFKKIRGNEADLERALLVKYPRVCPYCCCSPCKCQRGTKEQLNEKRVRDAYHKNASSMMRRSLNDFQLMFREIYQESWIEIPAVAQSDRIEHNLRVVYTRLTEEMSELAEAIRFYHLYSSNLDNELADLLAWWFALVSMFHTTQDSVNVILAEELMWSAYPGYCPVCDLIPCDCRPGPVRELLSKPSLLDLTYIDGLTQARNRLQFDLDLGEIATGAQPIATPIACVCIDLDSFKMINDTFSHAAGDDALRNVVTLIRQRIRPRDRLYRFGGDEFVVMCPDLSSLEAQGMMSRVSAAIKQRKLTAKKADGVTGTFTITLSVGIAECHDSAKITDSFQSADHAAKVSKNAGKDRITLSG